MANGQSLKDPLFSNEGNGHLALAATCRVTVDRSMLCMCFTSVKNFMLINSNFGFFYHIFIILIIYLIDIFLYPQIFILFCFNYNYNFMADEKYQQV